MVLFHFCLSKKIYKPVPLVKRHMLGGDIDKAAVQAAFHKIKEDMERMAHELQSLKLEHQNLKQENLSLKGMLTNRPDEQPVSESDNIARIVRETLKNIQPQKHTVQHHLIKKINKGKKSLILSRILSLAEKKNMSSAEIKDIVVDHELLCSKATFYRYIEKMKQRSMIDLLRINEMEVVVKLQ
jgi:hypothetical protein